MQQQKGWLLNIMWICYWIIPIWNETIKTARAHQIKIGISNGNQVQVGGRLSPTDNVAENAQYLFDSDSFIQIKDHEKGI